MFYLMNRIEQSRADNDAPMKFSFFKTFVYTRHCSGNSCKNIQLLLLLLPQPLLLRFWCCHSLFVATIPNSGKCRVNAIESQNSCEHSFCCSKMKFIMLFTCLIYLCACVYVYLNQVISEVSVIWKFNVFV